MAMKLKGASLVAQMVVSACNAKDTYRRLKFDPWVGKIPWRRKWQPTPVFLPENSMAREAWQATVHEVTKESATT